MRSPDVKPLGAEEFVAVLNLLGLYGEVFDGRRWDDLDLVFTSDCVVDYSAAGRGVQRGIPTLRQHMVENPPLVLSHMFTNPRAYQENGTIKVHSVLLGPQPAGPPWTGTYDDVLVRTGDGLRISERIVLLRTNIVEQQ
jgi:hypothetical protein